MRWIRRSVPLLLAVAVVLLGSNCAWRVEPPEKVSEPAAVFLTEYGRHTRLALPAEGPELIEYGFGEWRYYGLEEHGGAAGARAIAGMGTGAQSRRVLPTAADEAEFLRVSGGARTARIVVERRAADALRNRLEARWERVRGGAVRRERDGVFVAPDSGSRYHLFRNSNHATAERLRELGCRVTGQPVFSNFRVVESREAAAP